MLPASTYCTPSCRAISRMSRVSALKAKLELRAATLSSWKRASAVMMSSVTPSVK
jgi:hypothetical protein